MHKKIILLVLFLVINTVILADETLIFIRHAEKPLDGLGQLSCKGFNRSVSLPSIILKKFGEPDYLFAPNPTIQKLDKGSAYNYLRPLATLEPLAIKLSKNINLTCGYNDIECITNLLLKNTNEGKTILIAWEHHNIEKIIRNLAKTKHIHLKIPTWESDDFDTIYVIKVGKNSLDFMIDQEGLNKQNSDCNF